MNSPEVSVVIPVFNDEHSIDKTLKSVLSQSFRDFEIIVVDDCSTDSSALILEKYAIKNKIRFFKNEFNSGAAVSRNKGIAASYGRFIAFLDSDDTWHPKKLEKQIDFMVKSGYPVSYTGYSMFDPKKGLEKEVSVPYEVDYIELLKSCFIGFLTSAYDTQQLGKRYFLEVRRREDYIFWLSILKEGFKAGGLRENLATYRQNSSLVNKIRLAKYQWGVYRKFESMSYLGSSFFFINYCYNAFRRNYT